jgi:hypothetical protein
MLSQASKSPLWPFAAVVQAIDELLADHPHRHTPGATIDVLEFLPIPGM